MPRPAPLATFSAVPPSTATFPRADDYIDSVIACQALNRSTFVTWSEKLAREKLARA
jgi:hypothetical protein